MTNKRIKELKKKAAEHKPSDKGHSWDDVDSSRCSKCGDKDWMAGPTCSGDK